MRWAAVNGLQRLAAEENVDRVRGGKEEVEV